MLAFDVSRSPGSRLLCHRPQLRQVALLLGRDVGHVPDGIHARESLDGQVGLDVDPSPVPALVSGGAGQGRSRLTAAPDHELRGQRRPVVELDPIGLDLGDADPELRFHPAFLQLLLRVAMRLLRELWQQHVAAVHDADARLSSSRLLKVQCGQQLSQRAGRLDAGRTGTHDDDVQRISCVVGLGGLQEILQPDPQPFGVDDRVEREGVLGSSRYAEEVGSGTRRQDDEVAGQGSPVVQRDCPCGQVHARDGCDHDLHGRHAREDRLERARHVASRKLRRGDLVEQGLELVIVVAVDERDGQPCLDEPLRAADSGESSTDDNGVTCHGFMARRSELRLMAASRVMAASISARCVNACGKLPSCSPVSAISSE